MYTLYNVRRIYNLLVSFLLPFYIKVAMMIFLEEKALEDRYRIGRDSPQAVISLEFPSL
jgi:hypothetical protein